MILRLRNLKRSIFTELAIPASKSISNRCLIIQALSDKEFEIRNLAPSSDTILMKDALSNDGSELNLQNAGTTFRFLTAYMSLVGREVTLTGTDDMKRRPIGPLVDALKQLGASIDYLEKENYPPIKINSNKLHGFKASVSANISSQYVSALLLIAPCLPNGLELELKGEILSRPYLEMTIALMKEYGVEVAWNSNTLMVQPQKYIAKNTVIEGDWSSASYWYGLAALSDEAKITLKNLSTKSVQGDKVVAEMMKEFGVDTIENGDLVIKKAKDFKPKENLSFDFRQYPDLALTVAVVAAGLGVNCELTGLHALPIKESDRLQAVCTELQKLEYDCSIINDNALQVKASKPILEPKELVNTYQDHRIALAFSLLNFEHRYLEIEEPDVINKSYPNYWNDLKEAGFDLKFYD
ncbi:MAG: 3-phosphoshikimate 1-carboxyvinyltransferase [Bacteroidia bacterium]|nr:3-phosphoshikimate 1-carboxyvinyltransferase [Bacteroidia bacterium]NNM15180.1 3-phosphoshikimate 1-carboxyvinyltransferase [Bacteroidia bacterium]